MIFREFYKYMADKYPFLAFTFKGRIGRIKDLIAYRIVISLPQCHLKPGESREERELGYLYEVADALPDFLEKHGFKPEL